MKSRYRIEPSDRDDEIFKQVYPPDYEAADAVLKSYLDHGINPEWFTRDKLAESHARVGPSYFMLIHGLKLPRHDGERVASDYRNYKITSEDYERLIMEFVQQPLSIEILEAIQEELELKADQYGQLMMIPKQIDLDQRNNFPIDEWEPIASYYARELQRNPSCFVKDHAVRLLPELDDLRFEAGLGICTAGKKKDNSVLELILGLSNHIGKNWQSCVRIAYRSQTEPEYLYQATATYLFLNNAILDGLPSSQELMTEIRHEFQLIRRLLKSRKKPKQPTLVEIINTVDVNVKQDVDENFKFKKPFTSADLRSSDVNHRDSNTQIILFQEDYEAAERILAKKQIVEEEYRTLTRELLAKQHAIWGPRQFEIIHHETTPQVSCDDLLLAVIANYDNPDQIELLDENYSKNSISVDILDGLILETKKRLNAYDQFLLLIAKAYTMKNDIESHSDMDARCEYLVREMCRRSLVLTSRNNQREKVMNEILELRYEAGREICSAGDFSANSAYLLISHVTDNVAMWWKNCQNDLDNENSPYFDEFASSVSWIFFKWHFAELPISQDLTVLMHDEVQVIKRILRNRPPLHQSPENNFSDSSNHITAIQGEGAQTSNNKTIIMKDYAVGCEAKGVWWLFSNFKGEWRQRCSVTIPTGHAEILMQLLADGGGSMDESDARSRIQKNSGTGLFKKTRSVTNALSKAKKNIREAISKSAKISLTNVPNPIPNVPKGWIASINIGYAVQNDHQQLEFRLKEDIGTLE